MKIITATELARNLRQVLDNMTMDGEEILVERNHQPIARILPGSTRQTALQAMSDLYRVLPDNAAKDWLEESRSIPSTLSDLRDPWAS